jgi:hypothetical protein
VVGALAVAELARLQGIEAAVGGLTWERNVVDPLPGPRPLREITGARPIADAAALAGPDTAGPGGFRFAESRMAGVLGEPVLLLDPTGGPAAVAAGLAAAADALRCDLVVLVDVGGDVLAHGHEPGLGSPLADAVCLAAAAPLAALGVRSVAAVVGAGCDGELRPAEVAERVAEIRAAGGLLGSWDLGRAPEAVLARLEEAVAAVPTEASAMALRAARGERGTVPIRGGRRTVELTAAGGEIVLLDCAVTVATAARCAALVAGAGSLEQANAILRAEGIATELDWEAHTAHRAAGRP